MKNNEIGISTIRTGMTQEKIIGKTFKKSSEYWSKRNRYYHKLINKFYQFLIPKNQRIILVGGKPTLLAHLKPLRAVTVSLEPEQERDVNKHVPFEVYQTIHDIPIDAFDYIILSGTTHEVDDIQQLFSDLLPLCHDRTRVIIDIYSIFWEPILWMLQKLRLKKPTPLNNWITLYDLKNLLLLSGFEPITVGRLILLPCYIPIISWLFNTWIAPIPFINRLCLVEWLSARPKAIRKNSDNLSVSIIIPCRNEQGNIEHAVTRCPIMGKKTEIIFVEGHSRDKTLDEIQRVAKKYPHKNVSYYIQKGEGKGDAVRTGFAHATGDVLMIQDADLTTMPEELPKFLNALCENNGEFINGSRLIYGMEMGAMRFLNIIANHCFAIGFSWLLGQRIKDTLCGTKVLFKQDYDSIAHNRSYFGNFDPFGDFDLLFGAAKLNLKIVDLPVHYKARTYGDTQIRRFYHGIILLKMSFFACRKFKFRS